MARQLLEAILDEGVHNPNYFEGRLLTAAALREDQEAHRTRQRQLGRAIGRGIAEGLWVTVESAGSAQSAPLVRVGRGLAINGLGQALELKSSEVVALAVTKEPPPPGAGIFKTCEPPTATIEGPGEGFYVLVLSPSSDYKGRAPASGLKDPLAGAGCGSRWAVEGVRFRLLELDPLAIEGLSASTKQQLQSELLGANGFAARSRLRNVVAHLCLGTEALAGFAADPFATESLPLGGVEPRLADYGGLDALVAKGSLTDCDVPLALVHLRTSGLIFVDNWSVRRRLQQTSLSTEFPTLTGGRRRAEAEAVLFQFQEQLAALIAQAPNPNLIEAKAHFRWLPPVGLLPLPGPGRPRGVGAIQFFNGVTARAPIFLEGARLPALIASGFAYPPVDLDTGEMVWRYQVRENRVQPDNTPPLIVFASGHVPFLADAQFDLAHWNFANYGSVLLG